MHSYLYLFPTCIVLIYSIIIWTMKKYQMMRNVLKYVNRLKNIISTHSPPALLENGDNEKWHWNSKKHVTYLQVTTFEFIYVDIPIIVEKRPQNYIAMMISYHNCRSTSLLFSDQNNPHTIIISDGHLNEFYFK